MRSIERAVSAVRTLHSVALVAVVSLVSGARPTAAQGLVQVNFRPYFNADVIINGSSGAYDSDMGTIEGAWAFATTTAANGACGGPWLPDDAYFPADVHHPEAQLGWSQADDGFNAWQTFDTAGEITVDVPNFEYDALYLYATGAWETALTVTLNYTTGDADEFTGIAYPSWFDEAPPGFFNLVDGLDRAALDLSANFGCENANDPGIVGRTFPVDPTRVLKSFTLTRTDDDQGVLNVFGATAVTARQVFDFDMTSLFNADVVANGPDCTLLTPDIAYQAIESPNWHMPTATMAACHGEPPGLPDDGYFPTDGTHPGFQLAYRNSDFGLNARRSVAAADSFVIDIPDRELDEVHLFGTSGDGWTDFNVELQYASGPSQIFFGVILEDWLFDGSFSGPPGATTYYLIDGMDKHGSSSPGTWSVSDVNDAALFGVRLLPDPARSLASIKVQRFDPTGLPLPQSTLAILGAAGVVNDDSYIFADEFEIGDMTNWTASVP